MKDTFKKRENEKPSLANTFVFSDFEQTICDCIQHCTPRALTTFVYHTRAEIITCAAGEPGLGEAAAGTRVDFLPACFCVRVGGHLEFVGAALHTLVC